MARSISAFKGLPNGALSPKQESIALILAGGTALRVACRKDGVGETTVKRWLKDPVFVHRVTELRSEMTNRALGRLCDGMALAADALRKLLSAESESVRLGAARAVLELGTKLRESVELEQRVTALELDGPG
jgi:hypothetical protein